ncbi:hypothetical protein AB0F43_07035 [Kribbella sp. NPDC023972]|uniref:hypothetical protein n=1 Tax=Kribbella sp. NPDC023972 TaxID=3154795 RepID=UPI0033DEC71F
MRKVTWVGVGCLVLAFVVSGFFVLQLVRSIPGAPTPIDGGPVRLDGVGLTIFASERGAGQTCTAKDANGRAIALKEPSRSEKFDNGDVYYVVAHSVEKIPAQTVDVVCTNQSATYFAGRRHTAETFLGPALTALGSFVLFGALGTVLIVVAQRKRGPRPVR